MLQSFRDNTQSIVIKIVIGFIIITFALFGVDSLIGLVGQPSAPVTINGVDISDRQIQEGIDLQRRQLMAQMGENADPSLLDDNLLRGAVVRNLIEEEVVRQAAEEQGLIISDQYLDASILATREFQVDGRFDRNQFEAMLRNVGMTPLMYREYLRKENTVGQGRSAIVSSAFVLPSEVERVTSLDRQLRDFSYLEIDVESVLGSVAVDEETVRAHYESNKSQFKSEEQVSVNYVELNKQVISETIEVDNAELQSQYEALVDTFKSEEGREAAHVLVTVDDQRSEEDALKLVLELMKQIEDGKDFAEVAKENSDDPGSAEDGGSLGVVEKGVMVPEFEEALFALEKGQVSEPVRTDFGYHLIKLTNIETMSAPAFDQVKDQLAREQKLQKAESLFVAKSEELDDLRFSASDLQEASEVLGLDIQSTDFFSRNGGASALEQAPRFLAAAFSEDVLNNGENSELIELDADRILVVHMKEHKPARIREFEEVKDQIETDLKRQLASDKVTAEAAELVAKAKDSGLEAAEGVYSWKTHQDQGRASDVVAREVITEVFKMPQPNDGEISYKVITLSSGSAAVLALEAIKSAEETLDDTQRKGLEGFLANRLGQADYRDLVENLKAKAEVEQL